MHWQPEITARQRSLVPMSGRVIRRRRFSVILAECLFHSGPRR
jgi:hypothetical protein